MPPNPITVLNALFSLTATGLYASYIIPILLRITVARHSFAAAEWNLGSLSVPAGCVSFVWGLLMIIVLCLPSVYPVKMSNLNYSPLCLGIVLVYALAAWYLDARRWFKGAVLQAEAAEVVRLSESAPGATGAKRGASHGHVETGISDFIPLAPERSDGTPRRGDIEL